MFIKMFLKRNTMAGKVYAYRLFLSFKTLVTYNQKLTSRRTTVSFGRQLPSGITRFFARNYPMSGANIQGFIKGCEFRV